MTFPILNWLSFKFKFALSISLLCRSPFFISELMDRKIPKSAILSIFAFIGVFLKKIVTA